MNRIMHCLCAAICATVVGGGWCRGADPEPARTLSLSEIVLVGLQPVKVLNPAHYRKDGRPCLQAYLAAVAQNSFLWSFDPPSTPEVSVVLRKRVMVEQMVALLGGEVRAEAEAFTKAVPLVAEWEGMSEGPVTEADFAANWLIRRPETPIAPFLHLFQAHRLRAGYEAAQAKQENGLLPILARRYRETLNQAKSSTNPLISCVAEDLEAQPFVYLESQGRP